MSSPVLYRRVVIVIVRECIVGSGSQSAPRLILGVGVLSVLCCFLGAEWPNISRVCAGSEDFPSCMCRVLEEQLSHV